ncbi:MAG: sugar transferase [Ruminococcaceae bacterium]|nr:sugar transferase [Oscillospiraceae bacterium]
MRGKDGFYAKYVKRALDILLSAIGMILFCWLYAMIAILVRVKLGSPVIYKAKRPGKIDPKTGQERVFALYKFRSMTNEKDENGRLLPDTKRLTRFGRILRATSLDELPEVYNIFKGDMSLVGPRPLAASYLQYYTEEEHHRHDVRPGLTGLAQVSGRNSLSWEQKFKFDLQYVKEVSFRLDVRILFMTVLKVFKREGIGQGEKAPVSLSIERKDKPEEK